MASDAGRYPYSECHFRVERSSDDSATAIDSEASRVLSVRKPASYATCSTSVIDARAGNDLRAACLSRAEQLTTSSASAAHVSARRTVLAANAGAQPGK